MANNSDNMMISFLKRAAERTGFQRDTFLEKDIPTTSTNICVVPFFGDLRSTCLLSSFLLKPLMDRKRQYTILCSWPGFQGLFPYVNEYWSLKDGNSTKTLALGANSFYNKSELDTSITRSLIQHFENVVDYKELKQFYDNGFTKTYWQSFKEVRRYLPGVTSSSRMSPELLKELERKVGYKVVVFPVTHMRFWQHGRLEYLQIPQGFWKHLIGRLSAEGFVPVVYQNHLTYDVSPDFGDKCVYLVPKDISQVLCAIREIGCVLDIHSGISRLAIAARCPFVVVDQRARFMEHKEYEIDDLCCEGIPKQYIFSFSTMILTGSEKDWDTNILDNVMDKLKTFMPTLDRSNWMSLNESYDTVSFDKVRDRTAKHLGVNFIRKR